MHHVLLVPLNKTISLTKFLLDVSDVATLAVSGSRRCCNVITILWLVLATHGGSYIIAKASIFCSSVHSGVSAHKINWQNNDFIIYQRSENKKEEREELTPIEKLLASSKADNPYEQCATGIDC